MNLPRPHILLSVLEEHFLELDVLWERREASLFDPELTVKDLADLERRAQRHLEGLLVGQGHALELARRALQGDERGAATAGGFVMLDLGISELRIELVRTLATAKPEVAHGIRIALRHRDVGGLEPVLRELAASDAPLVRACACDVLAFHRLAPVAGVRAILADEDEEVRALAVAAIGRWNGPWQAEDLREQLGFADAALAHRAALGTSARVSLRELPDMCREAAYREVDPSAEALKFLGMVGDASEIPRLQQALNRPDLAEGALAALGALGVPSVVPILLAALEKPLLAHAAAAAFLRVTGAEGVQGEPVAAPDGLDEEEAEFWDEYVAVDAVLARGWWEENRGRFLEGERWQRGGIAPSPAKAI
jgi:uncharacterized protein (TIGR02270 family)